MGTVQYRSTPCSSRAWTWAFKHDSKLSPNPIDISILIKAKLKTTKSLKFYCQLWAFWLVSSKAAAVEGLRTTSRGQGLIQVLLPSNSTWATTWTFYVSDLSMWNEGNNTCLLPTPEIRIVCNLGKWKEWVVAINSDVRPRSQIWGASFSVLWGPTQSLSMFIATDSSSSNSNNIQSVWCKSQKLRWILLVARLSSYRYFYSRERHLVTSQRCSLLYLICCKLPSKSTHHPSKSMEYQLSSRNKTTLKIEIILYKVSVLDKLKKQLLGESGRAVS